VSPRLHATLPLASDVTRLLRQEITRALEHLALARAEPEERLHKCRRRLKTVRALLRLVRSGDEAFFAEENARYRDVSARLSGLREASAMVETAERLGRAYPRRAASVAVLRQMLAVRREAAMQDTAAFGTAVDAALAACRHGLLWLGALSLPADADAASAVVVDGAQAGLGRARKAFKRARSHGRDTDFHTLRKAVRAHATQLALLEGLWPERRSARRHRLGVLDKRLGALNDIAVLGALVRRQPPVLDLEPEVLADVEKCLKREGKRLRKQCLADAKRLFARDWKRKIVRLTDSLRQRLAATPVTALRAA